MICPCYGAEYQAENVLNKYAFVVPGVEMFRVAYSSMATYMPILFKSRMFRYSVDIDRLLRCIVATP